LNCRHSRLSRLAAVGVGLLTVVAVPHAQAQTFTASFPSGASTVVGGCLNPPGSLSYFSSVSRGDKVEQTFSGTGLNSITGLALNFDVTHNELSPAAQVDWDVRVNGTPAGTWQWTAGEGLGPVHLSYTFAPIVGGGTYDVGMFVSNEVPSGSGPIGVSYQGTLTLHGASAAPEPRSLALLATGGLPLFGFLRRRQRV